MEESTKERIWRKRTERVKLLTGQDVWDLYEAVQEIVDEHPGRVLDCDCIGYLALKKFIGKDTW